MAEAKGEPLFGPKVEASVVRAVEKAEKKEERPKKVNLIEHLESVVKGLEKRDAPFSSEERVELQGLQKRLSRTLGDYRDPNPE